MFSKPITRMSTSLAALALCGGAALFTPAPARAADDDIVLKMNSDELQTVLKADGFAIDHVDSDGDLVFLVEGLKVTALIQSNKKTIVFHIGWTGANEASMKKVNEWNKTKLFSRAYIDNEGDPILEMDLDMHDGVTMAHVKHIIENISPMVAAFRKDVLD